MTKLVNDNRVIVHMTVLAEVAGGYCHIGLGIFLVYCYSVDIQ